MRSKSLLSAIVAVLVMATASSAQTISYINFMQFDLQSFRSQATAGIFQDDVDMVADAANLTMIEGNRLFTNFSNLSNPATTGDNILSYGLDRTGSPSTSDEFDSGSYLVGWIGKYSQDSDYNFSLFYQRNSAKSMFEDLGDLNLGFVGGDPFDAEYSGFIRTTTHDDSTGAVVSDQLTTFDLERYDQRSAMNFDLGAARDLSEELTLGGRFFWEDDQLDSFASGTVEVANRTVDATGAFVTGNRSVTEWWGNGEEAFRNREIGLSLDADYHPWDDQDLNFRLDVFGTKVVNPSSGLSIDPRGGFYSWETIGQRVNLTQTTNYQLAAAGSANPGGTVLDADHENSNFATGAYAPYPGVPPPGPGAVQSVDDDRTGIGFGAKVQWDREWAGGENRAWAGYGHRGLDLDATTVAVRRSGSTFWWNGGAGDREATITDFDETTTTTRDGDMSLNVLEIGTRWNRPLNQHVSMGLGIILTRETWEEDYRQENTFVAVTGGFDDGDPDSNALYAASGNDPTYNEEYTRFTDSSSADVNDETRTTFVRLPVGAQFHFRDRWTVNVGAQHTIRSMERETSWVTPLGGNGPGMTEYVDVGGAGTPPSPNPSYDPSGFDGDRKITDKDRLNSTTYWYGLSVMITDAAQLDINGFFDTLSNDDAPPYEDSQKDIFDVDFFRNLAISLKYIFW